MILLASLVAAMLLAAVPGLAADRIAAGWRHSVAIDDAGAVWTWGENRLGQLGNGTFAASALPVPVVGLDGAGTLTGIVAVAAGTHHTLAVRADGTLWAWGNNAFGQLGNGEFGLASHSAVPVQVRGPGGQGFLAGVVAAAGGWDHSVAVLNDGTVWTWGSNCQGQLGDGRPNDPNRWEVRPVQVLTADGPLAGVTAVACGAHHTLALREDGTLWAWGANSEGQLGVGVSTGGRYLHQFSLRLRWTPPSAGRWRIGLGYTYTDPDHLYAADRVELVDDHDGPALVVRGAAPEAVTERTARSRRNRDFVEMASTLAYPSAARVGGRVALELQDVRVGSGPQDNDWVEDLRLVLTNEDTGETVVVEAADPAGVAKQVRAPDGPGALTDVAGIAAGMFHSVAFLQDGTAVGWGYNGSGQVGDARRGGFWEGRSDVLRIIRPTQVKDEAGEHALGGIAALAAGYETSYALLDDGTARAWGWNVYGELGNGLRMGLNRDTPQAVKLGEAPDVPLLGGITQLAAGARHALALDEQGVLWAWGHNGFGQVGDGSVEDSTVPVRVAAFERREAPQAAGPPDASAPAPAADAPPASARVFNVRDHDAVGDGLHLDMPALQAAIDAAHEAGGGLALVPPGVYRTGTLELRSGVTLHLQEGAVILGSTNREHYSGIGLIYAREARDIGLTGPGVVDGQGQACPSRGWRVQIIHFTDCDGITVQDVTTKNSGSWTQHYVKCSNLTIRNATVNSPRPGRNNDGIDLSGCRDVLIEGCTVISDDDAIVIKSQAADRINENIRVLDNVTYTYRGAFKMGTETRGDFRNMVVRNLVGYGAKALEVYSVDGSHVEGVDIEGVRVEDALSAISIRLGARLRESYFAEGEERVPGVLRNVRIRDVAVTLDGKSFREVLLAHGIEGAEVAYSRPETPRESYIVGLPERFIEDVRIEDLTVSSPGGGTEAQALIKVPERRDAYPHAATFGVLPAAGFFIRHADGVTLRNARFEFRAAEARPLVIQEEARDLVMEGLAVHEAWR